MTTLTEVDEIWLCWHVDARWKGWWWVAPGSLSPGREPAPYVPLTEDHTLSLAFSRDPRELIVHVWTNATELITLEVFHELSFHEGPFKITNSDYEPVKIRLQALLESKGDSVVYSLKGAYRDGEAKLHTTDPKFTISRSG